MDGNVMKNKVLIVGRNGQLGQFLIKYLLENESVNIIGTARHKSYDNQPLIYDPSKIKLDLLDLSDSVSIDQCIKKHKPDYIFNTGANAFVGESWKVPHQHIQVNTVGVLNILESIRKFSPNSVFVNLGTSEEFGCIIGDKQTQNEETIISPRSPYGCSKAAARHLVNVYKESYGIRAVQPWAFNFESEIRGPKYFTRKVSMGVARIDYEISSNLSVQSISLGNLDSFRSWQYAEDVADALWKIANQQGDIKPYVISENETHSLRDFVKKSFEVLDIDGEWIGQGVNEKFVSDKLILVDVDEQFYRPMDVTYLNGDSSLLRSELNWKPKTTFNEIVEKMVINDSKLLRE
jgi:GDPmannose 4,6-dehydratase